MQYIKIYLFQENKQKVTNYSHVACGFKVDEDGERR